MTSLKFKGAVSGKLVDPGKTGVCRVPIGDLSGYVDEVSKELESGSVLFGTFFDANTPRNPSLVRKQNTTHRVVGVCYLGGDPHVDVEFTNSPYGKLASGYWHLIGLEPVLRIEEGKKPSFDIVMDLGDKT